MEQPGLSLGCRPWRGRPCQHAEAWRRTGACTPTFIHLGRWLPGWVLRALANHSGLFWLELGD